MGPRHSTSGSGKTRLKENIDVKRAQYTWTAALNCSVRLGAQEMADLPRLKTYTQGRISSRPLGDGEFGRILWPVRQCGQEHMISFLIMPETSR
jgi:hypothetical protein